VEEEYLKIAQAQERLAEIHHFIKSHSYIVFDICLSELQALKTRLDVNHKAG